MHLLFTTWLLLCLGNIICARNIELTDEQEEGIIECCDDEEIFVTADEGYQILITVEAFKIPYNLGTVHYLLVKSGTNADDGLDGIIFTHYINTPREYLSLKNELYIKFVEIIQENVRRKVSDEEDTTDMVPENFDDTATPSPIGEFLIRVRRFGDAPTTTEPTTTEIPWPTPSPEEPANITVNISGKSPGWYTENNVLVFREKVSKMAIEYCRTNEIHTEDEITSENVFIETVVQCPINWPDRKDCVQITFRLPIFQPDDEEPYQLNSENLEVMWLRLSETYLGPEFSNFGTPETSVFTIWLIIICVTIVLFSVVLYLFKRFSHRLSGLSIRKKPSDDDQDNLVYTKAPRNDSLSPHPKQIVPGMFESENQYYDPDSPDNMR